MEKVQDFRDQMFYREMLRLREEQRSRIPSQSSNVVSLSQYRQRLGDHPFGNPLDKPTKPAA